MLFWFFSTDPAVPDTGNAAYGWVGLSLLIWLGLASWLLVTTLIAKPKNTTWLRLSHEFYSGHRHVVTTSLRAYLRFTSIPATAGNLRGSSPHCRLLLSVSIGRYVMRTATGVAPYPTKV